MKYGQCECFRDAVKNFSRILLTYPDSTIKPWPIVSDMFNNEHPELSRTLIKQFVIYEVLTKLDEKKNGPSNKIIEEAIFVVHTDALEYLKLYCI